MIVRVIVSDDKHFQNYSSFGFNIHPRKDKMSVLRNLIRDQGLPDPLISIIIEYSLMTLDEIHNILRNSPFAKYIKLSQLSLSSKGYILKFNSGIGSSLTFEYDQAELTCKIIYRIPRSIMEALRVKAFEIPGEVMNIEFEKDPDSR